MSNKFDSKTNPGEEPRPVAGASSKEKAVEGCRLQTSTGHSSSTTDQDILAFSHEPAAYQIRLRGHLGSQWTDWFGGLTITLEEDGDTLLSGPVADQAALYGLLKKARDLGMPLVSVSPVEPDPSTTLGAHQANASEKG